MPLPTIYVRLGDGPPVKMLFDPSGSRLLSLDQAVAARSGIGGISAADRGVGLQLRDGYRMIAGDGAVEIFVGLQAETPFCVRCPRCRARCCVVVKHDFRIGADHEPRRVDLVWGHSDADFARLLDDVLAGGRRCIGFTADHRETEGEDKAH